MLALVCAAFVLPDAVFKVGFISLLFGHYVLSFFYAHKQIGNLAKQSWSYLPLAILIVLSAAYIGTGYYFVYLIPFIGLHISLSETYMINPPQMKDLGHLNLSRFLLNIFLYLVLLQHYPPFSVVPIEALHAGVIAALIYFLMSFRQQAANFKPDKKWDFLLFELSGVLMAYIFFFSGMTMSYQFFVFYHVITWIVYPSLLFYQRRQIGAVAKFWLWTVLSAALFLLLSLGIFTAGNKVDLVTFVPLAATLHFLTSFPLSRLNPVFITRLFYPENRK